jgi:hypothetical protein
MTIFIILITLLFASVSIAPLLVASVDADGLVSLPE